MNLPGTPSLFFLAVFLVLLPIASLRSASQLRAMRAADGRLPDLSRERILASTLLIQALLLALAWRVGRGFDYNLFAVHSIGAREVLAASSTLALCFALRSITRMTRSEGERRRLFVHQLAPRTGREWMWWTATVLVAGVAEEAVYRGVGMSILWYSLGNPWIAALICSIAFALAHSTQGWKSSVMVFVVALLMHGLVAFTGTLVLAMGVHTVYNLVAGWLIGREAIQSDRERSSDLESP